MDKQLIKEVFNARFEAVVDNDPTLKAILRKQYFNFNLLDWQTQVVASAFKIALFETLETFVYEPTKRSN